MRLIYLFNSRTLRKGLWFLWIMICPFSLFSQSLYQQGLALAKKGALPEALSVLEKAATSEANQADIFFAMGFCYEQLAKPHQAAQFYQKTLQVEPDYWSAYFKLMQAYQAENKMPLVEKTLQEVLQRLPSDEERIKILGKNLVEQNETERLDASSLLLLQKFESLSGTLPPLFQLIEIKAYFAAHQYEKAQNKAENILNTITTQNALTEEVAYWHLKAAFQVGDIDKMSLFLNRIKREEWLAEAKILAPRYYYNLGYAYFFAHEFQKSEQYLRSALAIDPEYSAAQVYLNQIAARKADKSRVINLTREKMIYQEHTQHDISFYKDLARLYVHQELYNQAILMADSCLMLDKHQPEALFLKGIALYKTYKDAEAIKTWEVLVHFLEKHEKELDPEKMAQYYFSLALAYKRQKKLDLAQKNLQKAKIGVYQDAVLYELNHLKE
ncbi:tetratricopeptide repeat protein [Hugenholtzia roseola]|uniref:tetratricopeptide repeat protein n=1 Tax=Hugenholtzia roseola TaxID=1002 RepID=UPI00041EC1BA|nr:tetratricopeptide repeat protein [Hugenholtzia roseola]